MSVPEIPSAAELAAKLQGTAEAEPQGPDPKDAETYEFDFSATDSRGKVFSGRFVNHILTVGQQRRSGILRAQLNNNAPVESIDLDIWKIAGMQAHLGLSLDYKSPSFPQWARDFDKLYDVNILYKLYAEVMSHEDTFHRRNPNPSESPRTQ